MSKIVNKLNHKKKTFYKFYGHSFEVTAASRCNIFHLA